MVRFLVVFFSLFSLLSAVETKIGVVDLKKITEEYEGMKEAKTDLQNLIKEWEDELQKKKAKLDSLQKLYEQEKPGLSEEMKLKREMEIEKLKKEYENFIKEIWGKGGKIEQVTRERIKPITEKIRKAIKQIAEEEGVEIVFDISKDEVLYAKNVIDLTDRVLEALNREYKGAEIAEVGIVRKIKIAVFPFKSSQELIGSIYPQIFNENLEAGIKKSPKFDVYGVNVSRNAIKSLGYDENTLPESQINFLIQKLNVDYAVYGDLSRKGTNIILVKFYIYDLNGNKIYEENLEIEESETRVKEGAYAVAQKIIQYFTKEKK